MKEREREGKEGREGREGRERGEGERGGKEGREGREEKERGEGRKVERGDWLWKKSNYCSMFHVPVPLCTHGVMEHGAACNMWMK